MEKYDLIVVGAGAAGIMAAITAARHLKQVLLIEKLPSVGAKLKATGGGRCNLTNTLSNEEFMNRFGRESRFMMPALKAMNNNDLMRFFAEIGVECHAPDGYRVFPVTHNSMSIVDAFEKELARLKIKTLCSTRVTKIDSDGAKITGVDAGHKHYSCSNLIVATGGLGFPTLGAEGEGHSMAAALGHKVTELFPAMLPLRTKEAWVKNCRADTVAKVEIKINLPRSSKQHARGDLIFTANGIRGPVILDFAREITPLLARLGEVPVLVNLTQGMNEEDIKERLKKEKAKSPHGSILEHLGAFMAKPLARELILLAGLDPQKALHIQPGADRERLFKILAWTPLTIIGHDGFAGAMITRGGIALKEICPETLESRLLKGLYFCGEILDLDGPCGGFNLQWSFSSGFLAAHLGDLAQKNQTDRV
ncbi:MAG: NAD(P)/FAD-dependent oxidoreductase [Erysipelotrichia bacterium]|nr:NAD(P)/FAD-dependent oxidoreductase [Erysipelotrichia bacterium]